MSVGFALRSPVCDAAIIAGVTAAQHRHLDCLVRWRYVVWAKGFRNDFVRDRETAMSPFAANSEGRPTHNPLVEGSSPSGPTISIKFL